MHPNESEEVKKAIKERFGKEGKGRPHIYVEERRGDETVAIEAEPGPGKDSAAVIKARDIPTEGMDIVAGFLMQLKDGGLFEKERAAMALIKIVENSKDRKQIERVRDGVLPLKSEFPVLHRIVLKAMQNVLPDWNSSKPPIAIAPGNGRKPLESKDPTPMAPLKTR